MGVSTTDAASALVDQLCSAIDSGKVAVGVFLDLSNAFDTPDRVIMKLRHAKAHNRPSVGVPWCSNQQVHLSSLLRVLELKGILSLPIPGLCQPRSSFETKAIYRSTMPLQVQSHGTSLALGILPLLR